MGKSKAKSQATASDATASVKENVAVAGVTCLLPSMLSFIYFILSFSFAHGRPSCSHTFWQESEAAQLLSLKAEATKLFLAGDYARALEINDDALKLIPSDSKSMLADVLLNKASNLVKLNKWVFAASAVTTPPQPYPKFAQKFVPHFQIVTPASVWISSSMLISIIHAHS